MSGAASSGQFWICPQCRKHVPVRLTTCQCGLSRSGFVGIQLQSAGETLEPPRRRGVRASTIGVAGLILELEPRSF